MSEDRTPYEGALARGDQWFERSKETFGAMQHTAVSIDGKRALYIAAVLESLCGEIAYLTAAIQGHRDESDTEEAE